MEWNCKQVSIISDEQHPHSSSGGREIEFIGKP